MRKASQAVLVLGRGYFEKPLLCTSIVLLFVEGVGD